MGITSDNIRGIFKLPNRLPQLAELPEQFQAAIMVALTQAYENGYAAAMVDYCLAEMGESDNDDMMLYDACEMVEQMPDMVEPWAAYELDDQALSLFANLKELMDERM